MEAFSGPESATVAPDSSLQEKITELQKELKRERFEHCMIEMMYWDLHEDNGNYLDLNLQLEEAVEKLLLALSLPTDCLYRPELTDYRALIRLIDDESPRLKSLMSGLDLLASLAVGLNATVEMHRSEIRALRDEVCRPKSERAGETMESTNDLEESVFASRSHSSVLATGENMRVVQMVQELSEVLTGCPTREVQQNEGVNSESRHAENKGPKHITECETGEVQQHAGMNSESRYAESKDSEPITECKTGEVQQNAVVKSESRHAQSKGSEPLNVSQTQEKSRHVESKGSEPTNELGSLQEISGPPNPLPFRIRVHNVFDSLALKQSEINCAISVNDQPLAGNPFDRHPGWQIHYNFIDDPEHPHISLNFMRFMKGNACKPGGYQKAKGFKLIWALSRDTSFMVKEVKSYEPASLRNLPPSLTKLCADRHVRGILWQVALVGLYDSPPAHSRRILEDLDEHIKVNLKSLFRPGCANQIDIWFVNPRESNSKWGLRQDMDALIALQSVQ